MLIKSVLFFINSKCPCRACEMTGWNGCIRDRKYMPAAIRHAIVITTDIVAITGRRCASTKGLKSTTGNKLARSSIRPRLVIGGGLTPVAIVALQYAERLLNARHD